jgi:trimethylamine--corrinoid protein Co-methyltransferase
MARYFVPICFLPMPLAGATAPVTLAGTVVQTVAEFLSGVVLYQLAQPGCPMLFGVGASILDMHSGLYSAGAPELPLLNLALVEMGHYYGVPVMAQGVVTDAKAPGLQAGWEKMASGLVAALAGSDVINGLGLLDAHQLLSLEQMVFDDEIARMIRGTARGFEMDSERMMAHLIREVGCGGNFLGQRATLDFLKRGEHMEPHLGQRVSHDRWLKGQGCDVSTARSKAASILRDPAQSRLPEGVDRDLMGIVSRAGAVLTG